MKHVSVPCDVIGEGPHQPQAVCGSVGWSLRFIRKFASASGAVPPTPARFKGQVCLQLGLSSPQPRIREQLAHSLPSSSPAGGGVLPSENLHGEGRSRPSSPGTRGEGEHPRSHGTFPPAPRSWARSKAHFPFTCRSSSRGGCDGRRGEATRLSPFREPAWGWHRCRDGQDTFPGTGHASKPESFISCTSLDLRPRRAAPPPPTVLVSLHGTGPAVPAWPLPQTPTVSGNTPHRAGPAAAAART